VTAAVVVQSVGSRLLDEGGPATVGGSPAPTPGPCGRLLRPFIGNEDMQNVPALSALESGSAENDGTVSLDQRVQ
jgi:hypothetical protein